MPRLEPSTVDVAGLVSSWAPTREEVRAWCSRDEAPVPPEVVAGWAEQPDVQAYLLVSDGEPVGYGELWVDDEEREVELARIIVDPARRGHGLGRELARLLADAAAPLYPDVFLRVAPGNEAALACYRAAGFTRLDPDTEAEWNQGQPTPYLWMRS
jgi:ribosomal protein S18 acetylase RimI-like enzyme